MNVLYLTDPFRDYLADQIYYGLCKLLGFERVIDYPYKPIYHDPAVHEWFLPKVPGVPRQEDDILDLLCSRQIDLLVLSSPRRGGTTALEALAGRVPLPPAVLIDGEDDSRIRRTLCRRWGFGLYFKREFALAWRRPAGWARLREFGLDGDLFRRTHPLPFSIILETTLPETQGPRDIDVFFAARTSQGQRRKADAILRGIPGLGYVGGIFDSDARRFFPLEDGEYYRTLRRARIGVSVRGGGFDTLRYWEVAACGALLISEEPDILIPDNFEHCRHAVFCRRDLGDLEDLVRYYASHGPEREAIAVAGHAHLLKSHTVERRAEYFLAVCRRTL
ncbi:MAG: glycosyltransferase family 1 protein [Candidatus Rokubacteria bacterium]|nr:glycosyltransferase family 1 protein [Candidatus Rokubacteria bacterium]